jgi:hypothetical protein
MSIGENFYYNDSAFVIFIELFNIKFVNFIQFRTSMITIKILLSYTFSVFFNFFRHLITYKIYKKTLEKIEIPTTLTVL